VDGDHYELPAADALAAKYPLAATLLLRTMIDFHSRIAGPAVVDMRLATSVIARASLR
jgi:Family of unknown function (DUF6880)